MIVSIEILSVVVGSIIPLLVGLVTKEVASSGLKGVLNALLSVISGIVTVAIANDGQITFDSEAISAAVNTFLISIGTYYGIWKATGTAQKVQASTSNFGIGRSSEPEDAA